MLNSNHSVSSIELSTFTFGQKTPHSPTKKIKNSSEKLLSHQSVSESSGPIQTFDSNQSSETSDVHFIHFDQPVYPPVSRSNGDEGTVKIRIYYNQKGTITNTELIQSSGKPLLDLSVKKSVLNWKISQSNTDGMFEKSFIFKLKN